MRPQRRNVGGAAPRTMANTADARGFTRPLRDAKRPMVLVGLGIDRESRSAASMGGMTELPVARHPKGKGIVDETLPNFVA